MSDADRRWRKQVGLPWFLAKYPRMLVHPVGQLRLVGQFEFEAVHEGRVVTDCYELEIEVPRSFPDDLPTGEPQHLPRVFEVGGRIPPEFHRYKEGHLCLGSPLCVSAELTRMPTLRGLNDRLLLPYLYAFSVSGGKKESLPWEDLDHDSAGELQDYLRRFDAKTAEEVAEYLVRLTMGKRAAGLTPCSCKSGKLFSACHAKYVEQYRCVWSPSRMKLEACKFISLTEDLRRQGKSKAAPGTADASVVQEVPANGGAADPA